MEIEYLAPFRCTLLHLDGFTPNLQTRMLGETIELVVLRPSAYLWPHLLRAISVLNRKKNYNFQLWTLEYLLWPCISLHTFNNMSILSQPSSEYTPARARESASLTQMWINEWWLDVSDLLPLHTIAHVLTLCARIQPIAYMQRNAFRSRLPIKLQSLEK